MTAYEYAKTHGFKEFYCKTSEIVTFQHGIHGGETIHNFQPSNYCNFSEWERYKSFRRFANCEVVSIGKALFGVPILYVKWTKKQFVDDVAGVYKNVKIIKIENVIK